MRLLLLLALVACKGKADAVVTQGSCRTDPSVCEDYQSDDGKYVERQKGACKGVGTWEPKLCPTARLSGSCRETHGWTRTRHYYASVEGQPNPAVDKAKVECGAYGTWVEPAQK